MFLPYLYCSRINSSFFFLGSFFTSLSFLRAFDSFLQISLYTSFTGFLPLVYLVALPSLCCFNRFSRLVVIPVYKELSLHFMIYKNHLLMLSTVSLVIMNCSLGSHFLYCLRIAFASGERGRCRARTCDLLGVNETRYQLRQPPMLIKNTVGILSQNEFYVNPASPPFCLTVRDKMP